MLASPWKRASGSKREPAPLAPWASRRSLPRLHDGEVGVVVCVVCVEGTEARRQLPFLVWLRLTILQAQGPALLCQN